MRMKKAVRKKHQQSQYRVERSKGMNVKCCSENAGSNSVSMSKEVESTTPTPHL